MQKYCECGHGEAVHGSGINYCLEMDCPCDYFKAKHTDGGGGIKQSQPPQDRDGDYHMLTPEQIAKLLSVSVEEVIESIKDPAQPEREELVLWNKGDGPVWTKDIKVPAGYALVIKPYKEQT